MESMTTMISVQVDSSDKDLASNILKELGLNMSTYVNMAIKQLINKNGVPFEVVNPKPSRKLKKAIKEGDKILKEMKEGKRKGYNNMYEMIKDLES